MDYTAEIKNKYRFVLIREPYELMEYEIMRSIFPQLIYLKTTGYRQEYEKNVLPFDSSDFVASHLLLCDMTGPSPRPVLGFKSVTLKSCDDHRISFPMFGMLERADSDLVAKSRVQDILNSYRDQDRAGKIAYNGSFTILPELRQNKALMKHLWELSFCLIGNYYLDYGIDHVLAVCATKFNVHKKKEVYGWNYISQGQSHLEEYQSKALFGANLIPMELFTSSEACKASTLSFRGMWENRLTLDLEHFAEKKQAA